MLRRSSRWVWASRVGAVDAQAQVARGGERLLDIGALREADTGGYGRSTGMT